MSGKNPAFQFYPNDYIRDLSPHSNEIGGAWTMIFSHLWYAKNKGTSTKTLEQWSKLLGEKRAKTFKIISYLQSNEIATVEPKPLQNNLTFKITITSRRMVRDEKQREYEREKKKRQRECPQNVPPDVPDLSLKCPPPSSDLQSSTSSSLKNKKKNTKKKKVELTAQQQERFELFWKLWPKKKSKGDAEKAWATIEPDDMLLAKILAKIKEGDNSLDWAPDENGKRWILHPATWLNAKGWEDEYTPLQENQQLQKPKFLLPSQKAKLEGQGHEGT